MENVAGACSPRVQSAGTIPRDVDAARHILGIARNVAHVHETDAITLALVTS
ncbi:MAG: hypothetical protein IPK13_27660 [Deltaproteobacteria bacterium]|nr:hypothetical protein [Deltaproteobacteria bacterium]MBK8015093.1 hypothetical protein [Deltaproteobacteria bacterium]MBK8015109.1 hypothetical protein [Deltaproteobacteria bacterium]